MPDAVTHAALAFVASDTRRRSVAVFVLGSLLPDLISRCWVLFPYSAYWFFEPLHAPFPVLAASYLGAQFFEEDERRRAFALLIAGSFFHFFLDVFQAHMGGGYYWFFPWSWWTTEIPLYWPEDSLWVMPVFAVAAVVHWWRGRLRAGDGGMGRWTGQETGMNMDAQG